MLVEAMAAGRPRVGADVEGIPTVIEDGVDGFLFRALDVDDRAEKLDPLMGSPGLRRALGEAGRARVLREFVYEQYFRDLRGFCLRVIGED